MEEKLYFTWEIYNSEIDSIERYCHNCGKKVEFKDSLKRRQNANGKNIYYYAIYKCPDGHTWNKEISTFKAISGIENRDGESYIRESRYSSIRIEEYKQTGIRELDILLQVMETKERLDKFLASKMEGVSRAEIARRINEGYIMINHIRVKPKENLKEKDVVTIII